MGWKSVQSGYIQFVFLMSTPKCANLFIFGPIMLWYNCFKTILHISLASFKWVGCYIVVQITSQKSCDLKQQTRWSSIMAYIILKCLYDHFKYPSCKGELNFIFPLCLQCAKDRNSELQQSILFSYLFVCFFIHLFKLKKRDWQKRVQRQNQKHRLKPRLMTLHQ